MSTYQQSAKRNTLTAALLLIAWLPSGAIAGGNFHEASINGTYILSFDGAFSSAAPPFTGAVLQFQAAQIGKLYFDGNSQVWGEATLTFHNPTIPFAVRTRKSLRGTYAVSPDGHAVIEIDEFPLGANGMPAPERTNSVVYECYVVQAQQFSSCVVHSLISYQQGPDPRELPVTMAGFLRRQK